MGLQPKTQHKSTFTLRACPRCHQSYGVQGFTPTKSFLFCDRYLPLCNDCIDEYIKGDLEDDEGNWGRVNKLCQLTDVPFIPTLWEQVYQQDHVNAFCRYSILLADGKYEDIGWEDYFYKFKTLKANGSLQKQLPLLSQQARRQQKQRWGGNYDDQALNYLDKLYNGLMTTQNVNGTLQNDQAIKICKMSYEIDCLIRQGKDFDKALGAYDKLVKIAQFTPKNVKNINDFDTIGQLIKWLQKKGWKNQYYDDVTKDVVDETIKNIQAFNQRLYTNESGIGDDINHRIEMLKSVSKMEENNDNYYIKNENYDLDKYQNQGIKQLLKEEFQP